jgi:hypothetical protein
MSTNSIKSANEAAVGLRQQVSISRWVNEPYPAWDGLLTAHDVARLIRRPPWMVSGLAAVGQFPRRQRFRGKKIGWLKTDILDWMARASRYQVALTPNSPNSGRRHRLTPPNQQQLPLNHAAACAFSDHKTVSSIAGVSP